MHYSRLLAPLTFSCCFSLGSALSTPGGGGRCRCQPGESCWPSLEEWQAFNKSIQGNLVQVRPIGSVCHEPTYDKTACERITTLSSNSTWRASQPGSQQDYAWEVSLSRNETCYVGPGYASEPCYQGRIPRYSAMVETTEQAQEAVKFARKKRLRLVIKNTGHDSGGRSSAVDSFQILTQRLKDISFIENFVPTKNTAEPEQESKGPSVKIGAGVLTKELYEAADAHDYTVMAGECATVGIAGGYIQGGGVSTVLSPKLGLAVDLVQEFEVITAEGTVVVANAIQNQDLFWALRGGGGGTFGLVTSITMSAFGAIPAVVSNIVFEREKADETFWGMVTEIVYTSRSLSTGETSSQYWIGRAPTGNYFARLTVFFIGETDKEHAEDRMTMLLAKLNHQQINHQFDTTAYTHISTFLAIPQGEFIGGISFHQENILIQRKFYESTEGPAKLVEQLATVSLNPGDTWVANTLGGQVADNKDSVDNAMHRGWRSASILLVGNRVFGTSLKQQRDAQERMTTVEWPLLRSMGQPRPEAVYLNEADAELGNWQDWFWGDKYDRLLQIKNKWDPEGLFIVRHGVGSEDWDSEGVCRTGMSIQHQCMVDQYLDYGITPVAF